MKIANIERTVLSNTNNAQGFSIANNAAAFRVLSDGLYSNKVEAIIRELSCNAWDIHSKHNVEVPFEVHLPNEFTPYLQIIDYGTGIPHDQMHSIYCVYFESTKSDSNNEIGAFGLGSKSPFAYTDSFTVTNTHNGITGVYNIYYDEKSQPTLSLMGKLKETGQPNGVSVKMPVEEEDFHQFKVAANKILSAFDGGFKLIGDDGDERHVTHFSSEYESTAKVAERQVYFNSQPTNRINFRMGNILYPVDCDDNVVSNINFLKSSRIAAIDLNIGDVEVTPSRESISWNKESKEFVRRIVTLVTRPFRKYLESIIRTSKTKREFVSRIRNSKHHLVLRSMLANDNKYKKYRAMITKVKFTTNLKLRYVLKGYSSLAIKKSAWSTSSVRDEYLDEIHDKIYVFKKHLYYQEFISTFTKERGLENETVYYLSNYDSYYDDKELNEVAKILDAEIVNIDDVRDKFKSKRTTKRSGNDIYKTWLNCRDELSKTKTKYCSFDEYVKSDSDILLTHSQFKGLTLETSDSMLMRDFVRAHRFLIIKDKFYDEFVETYGKLPNVKEANDKYFHERTMKILEEMKKFTVQDIFTARLNSGWGHKKRIINMINSIDTLKQRYDKLSSVKSEHLGDTNYIEDDSCYYERNRLTERFNKFVETYDQIIDKSVCDDSVNELYELYNNIRELVDYEPPFLNMSIFDEELCEKRKELVRIAYDIDSTKSLTKLSD